MSLEIILTAVAVVFYLLLVPVSYGYLDEFGGGEGILCHLFAIIFAVFWPVAMLGLFLAWLSDNLEEFGRSLVR